MTAQTYLFWGPPFNPLQFLRSTAGSEPSSVAAEPGLSGPTPCSSPLCNGRPGLGMKPAAVSLAGVSVGLAPEGTPSLSESIWAAVTKHH